MGRIHVAGVVLGAFLVRAILLWWTRPEFVGWFNHSYYYWVQVRGLVDDGGLVFADMPLLFWLYAGMTAGLGLMGFDQRSGIVQASRLTMSLVLALLPLLIFALLRKMEPRQPLRWPQMALVLASGFLPLTVMHMPEILQKNILGIVLLAGGMLAIFRWLEAPRAKNLAVLPILFGLIVLTHLGSALAAILLLGAAGLVYVVGHWSRRTAIFVSAALASAVTLAVAGIAFLDPAVHTRAKDLVRSGIGGSPVEIVGQLVACGLVGLATFGLLRVLDARRQPLLPQSLVFSKVMVVWMAALLLPLWPGEVGMRMLLFVPLPLTVLFNTVLLVGLPRRAGEVGAALWLLVCLSLALGEGITSTFVYPNKEAIHAELSDLAAAYGLSERDLVIAPYAVPPAANWFLGTRAALVTAIAKEDFSRYDRVFVLNIAERPAPVLEPGRAYLPSDDFSRYQVMRHDVPLPAGLSADDRFKHIHFYPLKSVPDIWVFDAEGRWRGWRAEGISPEP